jgi:hypothetical protein
MSNPGRGNPQEPKATQISLCTLSIRINPTLSTKIRVTEDSFSAHLLSGDPGLSLFHKILGTPIKTCEAALC